MVDLLERYSLSDILIFTVFLVLAVKSLISLFDWCVQKYNKVFRKERMKINEKEELERRLKQGDEVMSTLTSNQEKTDKILNKLSDQIDTLIRSDKDAIKAYIIKAHSEFYHEKGWIDNFNLECLENRYSHYKKEGGNSFIDSFMNDLRSLPKHPVYQDNDEDDDKNN